MRMILLAAAAGLGFGHAAAADDCKAIFDAYGALAAAPAYHQTVSMPNAPMMEMVTIGDVLYIREDDAWKKMDLGPGMRAEMMRQTMPSADALKDCSRLDGDTIEGAAMSVYSYQPPQIEGAGPLGPQKVWIGDKDGLPHRMTSVGEADAGVTVEIVFDGVVPPAP